MKKCLEKKVWVSLREVSKCFEVFLVRLEEFWRVWSMFGKPWKTFETVLSCPNLSLSTWMSVRKNYEFCILRNASTFAALSFGVEASPEKSWTCPNESYNPRRVLNKSWKCLKRSFIESLKSVESVLKNPSELESRRTWKSINQTWNRNSEFYTISSFQFRSPEEELVDGDSEVFYG